MSYENIGNGIPMREIRAINTENKIRKRTGDAKKNGISWKENTPKTVGIRLSLCWVLISYL